MKLAILALACAAACAIADARAQNTAPADVRACTAIESDASRLACYDRAAGRTAMPAARKRQAAPVFLDHRAQALASSPTEQAAAAPLSLLDSRWELSPDAKLGTFNLRGYRPIFIEPVFATSDQNKQPWSPNPVNRVNTPQQLDNIEAKFQLSLKTKVWQGVFGDVGDLWVAYTQSSRWQVYNAANSRPFRETDYEPEALLVFATHYELFGWSGRMVDIGVDHQSNGRANPLSRSWNRVVADIGFERPGWTVMLRPWWRIPESWADDNNPDITDYVGRAQVQIIHEWKGQEFGLMLRDSLRGGSMQHGAGRLTWSFPIAGNLRGYAELFKGYGESLIDYNHNATYFGLGISLLDWY